MIRHFFYIIPVIVLFILIDSSSTFANNECSKFKAYPSYHQRCLLRTKRIERMTKAKESRKKSFSNRYKETSKTKEKIEKTKEQAQNDNKKIEEAIAKKAAEIKKAKENENIKTPAEIDALPEDGESESYTPIIVDPTQITDEQLKQIKSILDKKETNKSTKVALPDVGLGKIEYIDIKPVSPSELYQK